MAFALRRLTLADMDEAAVIHRAAFDQRLPWLAGLHTPAEDRAYFRQQVFTACEVWGWGDDAIVGFIAFRPGWIDQFYVLPDQQNRGAGSALLDLAKSRTPHLQLWTFQRNTAARRFYERRGFVKLRETDGRDNEEREPDILYRWPAAGATSIA
jgi:ribosomal protein S18 acetylase RimI-like enzyme